MPSAPSAGLLVFCRGPRAAIKVLLLEVPSGTHGTGAGTGADVGGATYRVPSWEHPVAAPEGQLPPELSIEERLRRRRRQPKPTPDDLLATARTGFAADFGLSLEPPFLSLGGVKQHRHRLLYVWACEVAASVAETIVRDVRDRRVVRFIGLVEARGVVVPAQRRFVDQLSALVPGDAAADR